MNLHRGCQTSTQMIPSTSSLSSLSTFEQSVLINRLKLNPGENIDILPHDIMKKYIAYARRYVKPQLNAEACKEIQKYFLDLRQSNHGLDSTPITTRYRHGQPNPDSHSTMKVCIRLPMSVCMVLNNDVNINIFLLQSF